MRRQEYELVASVIRRTMMSTEDARKREGIRMAAVALADALAQAKPAFDYHQFLTNAGVRA